MALLTTTIGSFPKPDYLPMPDWFRHNPSMPDPTRPYEEFQGTDKMDGLEELFARAARDVIRDQIGAGIDVPTDGEVRRENYIHYHCRHLDGIDFTHLTKKIKRSGTWKAELPTVTGPIRAREHFLPHDWRVAQQATDHPVKVTIPGPLTIANSTANEYYADEKALGADLAEAINAEIMALAAAGCEWIQVDEPVFAREPEKALAFGVENLERCFHGVPDQVVRTMHMCCGYPDRLDNEDYPKADLDAYFKIAPAIDVSSIQAVSIEDAHRYNDLKLLENFRSTKVIFGAVDIARSRVEPVEEIQARLAAALEYIEADRLIVAPDCGLGMLDRQTAIAKLKNLSAAARALG